jgi:hypothetical protein
LVRNSLSKFMKLDVSQFRRNPEFRLLADANRSLETVAGLRRGLAS